MTVDDFTPEQHEIAHRLLDHLEQHGSATCLDFPDLDQQEFEAVANALMEAISKRIRH